MTERTPEPLPAPDVAIAQPDAEDVTGDELAGEEVDPGYLEPDGLGEAADQAEADDADDAAAAAVDPEA